MTNPTGWNSIVDNTNLTLPGLLYNHLITVLIKRMDEKALSYGDDEDEVQPKKTEVTIGQPQPPPEHQNEFMHSFSTMLDKIEPDVIDEEDIPEPFQPLPEPENQSTESSHEDTYQDLPQGSNKRKSTSQHSSRKASRRSSISSNSDSEDDQTTSRRPSNGQQLPSFNQQHVPIFNSQPIKQKEKYNQITSICDVLRLSIRQDMEHAILRLDKCHDIISIGYNDIGHTPQPAQMNYTRKICSNIKRHIESITDNEHGKNVLFEISRKVKTIDFLLVNLNDHSSLLLGKIVDKFTGGLETFSMGYLTPLEMENLKYFLEDAKSLIILPIQPSDAHRVQTRVIDLLIKVFTEDETEIEVVSIDQMLLEREITHRKRQVFSMMISLLSMVKDRMMAYWKANSILLPQTPSMEIREELN